MIGGEPISCVSFRATHAGALSRSECGQRQKKNPKNLAGVTLAWATSESGRKDPIFEITHTR